MGSMASQQKREGLYTYADYLTSEDLRDEAIASVVQPDISIICEPDKIGRRGCVGAPDLAAEILSPSTAYKDQTEKLNLYERSGVMEYWVVNPERQSVQVFLLQEEGGSAKPVEYRSPEVLPLVALEGIEVSLEEVFAD